MELQKIARLLITAPKSGSGKTLITCGLLELLRRKGFCPGAFKCGPDYIDPMFHKYVLGIPGANLDSFFLPHGEVAGHLCRTVQKEAIGFALLEGVMGYYDGIGGVSDWASSFEIASLTKTPAILVIDCKGASLSAAAVASGFCHFRRDSQITALILNRVSKMYYETLAPVVERETGLPVLGYLPESADYHLESRHLGLFLPEETVGLRERIARLADQMEYTMDVEQLLRIGFHAPDLRWQDPTSVMYGTAPIEEPAVEAEKTHVRIGIARDEAFCFYYQENLELMEQLGAELVFFSPIHDASLPDDLDGLLLGGGYPENHAASLSANEGMRTAVKEAVEAGLPLLAECGGFLYLHQTLQGSDEKRYSMAGLLEADAYRTEKLSRFGYITLSSEGRPSIRGHEFHYWESEDPGTDWLAQKPTASGTVKKGREWYCMHGTGRQMMGFPHLYYPSNPEFLQDWLTECKRYHENEI